MENIIKNEPLPGARFNPLNDYLFYKVMGEKGAEKQLLGFLNAVLGRSGKKPISDIQIMENKIIAADIKNGKSCVLDVRASLEDGTKLNVEVQLCNEYNMDRRSLFYWSRIYTEGIERGQDYLLLPNVIVINIVDYDFPAGGKFHTCFHLREDTEPDLILTPALEIHFINMVKWRRIEDNKDNLNDPLHRWLIWLNEKSPKELIEEVINMDNSIMAASERQDMVTQDRDERDMYLRRQMAILDYNSGMNGAMREGIQKGHKELSNEVLELINQGLSTEEIKSYLEKKTNN